jgi:hypothetical protein
LHICELIAVVAERRRARFVSASVLVMCLALLTVSFATADRGRTAFGPPLGADYAGFYSAATLLNTRPSGRLYDFALQDSVYHSLFPEDPARLPYLHPPFVAQSMRPLAPLPFAWSFGVWLFVSCALYLAGLGLILGALRRLPRIDSSFIVLLAVSFEPFVMECWAGGQLSAFGFFSLALSFYLFDTDREVGAGMALGLCLYKPTLLVLILPMLILARRWRVVAGFALSGIGLTGLSVASVGWPACYDYLGLLTNFARAKGGGEALALPLSKYVDICSFTQLLFQVPSAIANALLALSLLVPLGLLAATWWRMDTADDSGRVGRRVLWASTLTWTLIANVYVGVYDSILVVQAALLTADATYRPGIGVDRFGGPVFPALLTLLYVSPWVSQHLARAVGFQPYVLVLLGFAAYQLAVARTFIAKQAKSPLAHGKERTPFTSFARSESAAYGA